MRQQGRLFSEIQDTNISIDAAKTKKPSGADPFGSTFRDPLENEAEIESLFLVIVDIHQSRKVTSILKIECRPTLSFDETETLGEIVELATTRFGHFGCSSAFG